MDPIEMYKIRLRAGVIQPNDPVYMLLKYIITLEEDNAKLRSEITNQQDVDRTLDETVREPKPRRPYKKRVREGEEIRGDSGTKENTISSES